MKGRYIITAIRMVLGDMKFLTIFFLLTIALIWIFLYIPVRSILGNDFKFQLSILTPKDFALLITLSSLTALSMVMNLYILRRRFSAQSGIALVGQGGFGGIVGAVGSIFGTASCTSCVASLFGFLGVSGVFFLLEYKQIITSAAIIVMFISLYFTVKKCFRNM